MKTEEARRREIKGLVKARIATNTHKCIIITYDTEEEIEQDGIKTGVIPACKCCGQEVDLYGL